MASVKVQQGLVLGMSTLAFTVCFMVWMMFAVLGVPVKELLQLNETQFGAAGGLLLPAGRCAACHRRLDVGQVGRP